MHTQEKHIQSPGKAIVANSASLPSFSALCSACAHPCQLPWS